MTNYFYTFIILAFISCDSNNEPSLEINLTTKNPDTFRIIKSFYLTSLTQQSKSLGFKNVACIVPNKFVLSPLKKGIYFGLLTIENKGIVYNVTIDSIDIKESKNTIIKELNLSNTTSIQ